MSAYNTEEERYEAVLSRDAHADSSFFYAVLTTGVYCYPSCPSKTSLKENTRYFDTRQSAIDNGFRACKRCLSNEQPLMERQRALVESACRLVKESQGSRKVEDIAQELSISRYHLQKLFKRFLGVSPKAYSNSARTQLIEESLPCSESVTKAVYEAGYNQSSNFYANGADRLGMSPKKFQSGGQGLVIQYAFAKTKFGKVIVATTAQGVCCILFGDSQNAMVQDLQARFSKATLQRDSSLLDALLSAVVDSIENPESRADFALDIQGTVFQEKVWRALRDIQPGKTASYLDIAKNIGKPKASRAVAAACAANPLAVVVPCHRVVRSTGEISGYRWGVDRKKKLLAYEDKKNTI
jgi:AraC family transcriptional regulator of adaptative response/methylated-DNA-[protein]-cysteine methyltransferase